MGLADRFYMRDAYHAPRMTTRLIIVLIAAFVIQSLLMFYGSFDITDQLALSVQGLRHGKVWQLVTFQFLHSAPWPWHVLFNCLGLYFFGKPVEEMLGEKKFISIYLLAGVAGGLLQALTTLVLPRHADFPVVGASAGVCCMIAIFCLINPMQELTTWIYFIPVNIRARYLLWFITGFSIFGTLIPFGMTAHAAHLGGLAIGYGFVRWSRSFSEPLPGWFRWPFGRNALGPRPGSLAKGSRRQRLELRDWDYISREVDPILDKISKEGLHSLTDKERSILDAARRKMK